MTFACLGCFTWWLNQTEFVGYVSADFCTNRDELYQTIQTKAQDWLRELPQSPDPILHFSTPDGRQYVVSGEALSGDTPFLFIPIQQKYPKSPMGTRGYIYTVSEKRPDFSPTYIKLIYVGDKIYCYERFT